MSYPGNGPMPMAQIASGTPDGTKFVRDDGVLATPAGGSLPSGVIVLWAGLLADVPAGWNLCDGSNGTPDLRGKFIKGWAAGVDPGGTGGGSYTPSGTNSAGAVTSNTTGITVSDHAAHTHSVTSNVSGTLTPGGTIAWPAGVPTATGAAVADHAAHTHSVTSNVAVGDHAAHTHSFTQSSNATTPDLLTVNTAAAGVAASGTTGNPSATLTHSVTNNAVTSGNPSATLTHSVTQPTIAWPAGVPVFSGTSNQAVSTTNNAVTSGNPSATLTHSVTDGGHTHAFTQPTFTGNSASPEPAYYKLAYIQKS